ncbi:hypothetical protein SBA3_690041 [Candidatus Sulfopaludibacter sp. SbA3]|nr:hypothetical protein SBA3_690041 [Candidatus Sulfopaludibacter sp. SbA3]
MFGDASSDPAQKALELLKAESKTSLLALGGGQGRDTFFARNGVSGTMLDYSQIAVDTVNGKAQASGLGEFVTAIRHDVRAALPCRPQVIRTLEPAPIGAKRCTKLAASS